MPFKTIVFILLCTIAATSLKAQSSFGFKLGTNAVNNVLINLPSDLPSDEYAYRLGFHAGIFTTIDITEKLGLQPELLFSNKGLLYKPHASLMLENSKLHLNYINIPFLISYKLHTKFKVLIGTELGYLVSARSKLSGMTKNVKFIWDNDFDFGLAAGINHRLAEKIYIDMRYIHGLSSVISNIPLTADNGTPIPNSNLKAQNRTFQCSIHYHLK